MKKLKVKTTFIFLPFLILICFKSNAQMQTRESLDLKGNVRSIEIRDSSVMVEKGDTSREIEIRKMEFDSLGYLIKDSNQKDNYPSTPANYKYVFSSDEQGNQKIEIDKDQGALKYTYVLDSEKNPIKSTSMQKGEPERNMTFKNTYNGKRLSQVITSEEGKIISTTKYSYSDSIKVKTTKIYNASGNLYSVSKTDYDQRELEYIDYNEKGEIDSKKICKYSGSNTDIRKWDGKGFLREKTLYTSEYDLHGNNVKSIGTITDEKYHTKINWIEMRTITYY